MAIALHALLKTVDLLDCPRHYAWLFISPLHGISLTTTCLSIGKDANVETIQSTLNQSLGILEDLFLGGKSSKAAVKVKFLVSLFSLLIDLELQCVLISNFYDTRGLYSLFLLAKGSHSAEDSDLAFHVLYDVVKLLSLDDLQLELRLKLFMLHV